MAVGEIASILRRGPGLIAKYLALLAEGHGDPNFQFHLEELLRVGGAQVAKKKSERRAADAR